MSHARVEEVSDSDLGSDPEEMDIDDFAESDIIRRVPDKQGEEQQTLRQQPPPSQRPPAVAGGGMPHTILPSSADHSVYADFQCLYPVYFDASRSRAEGRRVSANLAVRDPLAREIANACSRLRLPTLFEPEKTHPKDWANPGRVKVGLRKPGAGAGGPVQVKNKHHLYLLVAKHLQQNPTTEQSPGLRVRIGGQLQPDEGKPYPRPAAPRGWKMGELVPYLSAAMTGGGVSENLFKDMMREMQGGSGTASPSGAEEGGKKKKDKKGKGRA
ncbi:Signal recognition particle SEC65 subunit [Paramyrothecium foliicola]|nr:Signal recognition particle SEC65 subunit [Paramyrothecium foliicola]